MNRICRAISWLIVAVLAGCSSEPQPPKLTLEIRGGAAASVRLADENALAEALTFIAGHADVSVEIPESAYREFFEKLGPGEKLPVDPTGKIIFKDEPAEPFIVAYDSTHLWVVPVRAARDGYLILGSENQGGQRARKAMAERLNLSQFIGDRVFAEVEAALARQEFDVARHLAQNAGSFSSSDKVTRVLQEINLRQAKTLLAAGERSRLARDYRSARSFANQAATFLPVDSRAMANALLTRTLEDEGGELLTLTGHVAAVTSVAVSPDGKLIASGSEDHSVKLWDAATGQEVRTLAGHRAAVRGVAFRTDGQRVLSGGDDGFIKLWDPNTAREVQTMDERGWKVTCVGLSADGKTVLGGSEDHHVKLWDVATGRQVWSLSGHSWKVTAVAFSPDEQYALSASDDDSLILWDVAAGAEVRTLRTTLVPIKTVTFSRDGRFALSGGDDKFVKVWEVATGRELRRFAGHTQTVTSICLSPDGLLALSGSADGTVKLWRVATGEEIHTFTGHAQAVRSVAFSPDGREAVSGSADATVKIWQLPRAVWPAIQEAKK